MKNKLLLLPSLCLTLGAGWPARAQTPVPPAAGGGIGLAKKRAAQHAASENFAAKTTTTATYRGQSFWMERTPDDLLTGEATDHIARLETQLSFCYTVLLADTLNPTCPPEREATIRAAIKYINLNRLNWNQKTYRQELNFYLAEDKRRRRANDY